MRLAIELIVALYIIAFVWFWSLCRLSIPDRTEDKHEERESNLIPFERGLQLQVRKRTGT